MTPSHYNVHDVGDRNHLASLDHLAMEHFFVNQLVNSLFRDLQYHACKKSVVKPSSFIINAATSKPPVQFTMCCQHVLSLRR